MRCWTALRHAGSLLFPAWRRAPRDAQPQITPHISVCSDLVGSGYSYVVARIGPMVATRRSLNLGVASLAMTLISLQGTSLCLVTTTAEEIGAAMRWALSPLRLVGCALRCAGRLLQRHSDRI